MRRHRDGILWRAAILAVGLVAVGAVATAAESQESPATESASAATTLPTVPAGLIGPRVGPPKPPPILPEPKPTPPKQGTVTFAGKLPPDLRISLPALRVLGKGNVTINGDAHMRLSVDGTLWIDEGTSVSFDPASTGTKTREGDMWKFDNFSGTVVASGADLHLRAQGERLLIVVHRGKGTATMSGEGTFRLTHADGRLESGFLDATSVKKQFAAYRPTAGTTPDSGRAGTPPAGLIPKTVPEGKVYEVPKLPSEGGEKVAPPPGAPSAPTSPTATPTQ